MADNNGGFLGGAPQFNKAGANLGENETVREVPKSLQAYQIRNAIIVAVIVVMFAVLFVLTVKPFGIASRPGRGGVIDSVPPPVDPDHGN